MNYSLFDETEPIVSKEKEKAVIQALRRLISFTTLNKFCDPLTKLTTVKNIQRVLWCVLLGYRGEDGATSRDSIRCYGRSKHCGMVFYGTVSSAGKFFRLDQNTIP